MSCCSKIYVVEKFVGNTHGWTIATYDCAEIRDICDFNSVFQKELDFTFDAEEDPFEYYDSPMKYAPLPDVVHFLKEVIKEQERVYGKDNVWRRLKPLYKLLKAFNNSRWISTEDMKKRYYRNGGWEMFVVCRNY